MLAERIANIGEHRRVVAAIVGQLFDEEAARSQMTRNQIRILRRHHNHHLVRAIVVGDVHGPLDFRRELHHLVTTRPDCQHRHFRNGRIVGQFPIHRIEPVHAGHKLFDPDDTASGQCNPFAGAVSSQHICTHAQARQKAVHRPVRGQNRFGCPFDLPQSRFGGFFFLIAEKRRRKNIGAGCRTIRPLDGPIRRLEARPHLREVQAKVRQHIDVLRTFTGKQQRHLAATNFRTAEIVDSLSVLDLRAIRTSQTLRRPGKFFRKIIHRGGDDREPVACLAQRGVTGVGNVTE